MVVIKTHRLGIETLLEMGCQLVRLLAKKHILDAGTTNDEDQLDSCNIYC